MITTEDPATTRRPTRDDGDAQHVVRHVLLATDLEDASARAADEAIRLAAREHAVLQILTVIDDRHDRARAKLGSDRLRRQARTAGVRATSMVWQGDPAEAILEAAWTERPDVLFVGARHHRTVARLLGSVSARIVREAPCLVQVVPDA